jgi:hypothetical protein
MTVQELDCYFPPEFERLIVLRDKARSAAAHLAHCREEVSALEEEQRENFTRPAPREVAVRLTGQSLQRARIRLANAQADAQRLEDELNEAGRDIVFGRMTP